MAELPTYIQELVCSLAEVTDDDDYIIEVCLGCLHDRAKSSRIIYEVETGCECVILSKFVEKSTP